MTNAMPITPKRFRTLLTEYLDITWKDARRGKLPAWVRDERRWIGELLAKQKKYRPGLPFDESTIAVCGPKVIAAFERIRGVRGVEEILESLRPADAPKQDLVIMDDPLAP